MASDSHQEQPLSNSAESIPAGTNVPCTIFDKRQKWLVVFIISFAATFSGFASNIYFPALPTIASDLNVSLEQVNLTVTSYLIFQGIAPSFWGPVSDVRGRRVAYTCTFLVFLGACIGLAESKNYATLVVLRCLQSTGSASTIAIGSGVIGDITTRADRGGYMGIFQAGLLVPVAVGPVIGGALAESLGWRSIFWFLAIYSGVFLIVLLLFLPETLRSLVANGSLVSLNPLTRYPLNIYQKLSKTEWDHETPPPQLAARKSIGILSPFPILVTKFTSPIILFLAIYYAVWQMSITAMSSLFESRHGLNEMQIGLTFIAKGIGSMVGTLVTGKILDRDYRRVKAKYEPQSDVEAGDSSKNVSVIMTYLVDIFPGQSAAASASLNLARCLFAAGGTSFVMPMINGIGVGLTFTVCVVVQVIALVGPFVQWKFAGSWRRETGRQEAPSFEGGS
ncbi:hypothetical protein N7448_001422 [Penicillium atrosanguineum]|nr:hypothetical protein N7526_004918 [Penicillium atrosanguineum]KAJ5149844.1 hypothetical protein N7448_001422 [Penicillium atrosanguineum]